MIGAIVVVVVLVVGLPLATWAVAVAAIALVGRSLVRHGEAAHPGSELLDVNM